MSVLDKAGVVTESMMLRRPEDPHGVIAEIADSEDNSAPKFNGFTQEYAYKTEFRAYTVWYANQAQFQGRERLARQELLHFMYGPVLANLSRLRARISDRDWRAAMEVVDEMQKSIVE